MSPQPSHPDAYFEFGLASRRDTPTPFDRFHRHNEVELVVVESGAVTYLFSRGREVWRAGDEVLFWGAMPHQLVAAEPGAALTWLTVPLTWFLDWKLPAPFATAVLEGTVLRHSHAVAEDGGSDGRESGALQRIRRWHADLGLGDPERRRIVLLEVEAALRRMALSTGMVALESAAVAAPASVRPAAPLMALPPAPPHPVITASGGLSAGPLSKVEAMTQFIARHYTEPLRVHQIAAVVDLNPEYATTLFRQACGRSLIEYLTEHRVSHAQRLLATTDRKILDIAFSSGFQTPSRFYAAFEAHCGCAPRAYRQRVKSGSAASAMGGAQF